VTLSHRWPITPALPLPIVLAQTAQRENRGNPPGNAAKAGSLSNPVQGWKSRYRKKLKLLPRAPKYPLDFIASAGISASAITASRRRHLDPVHEGGHQALPRQYHNDGVRRATDRRR
jgi:hypothetical protein